MAKVTLKEFLEKIKKYPDDTIVCIEKGFGGSDNTTVEVTPVEDNYIMPYLDKITNMPLLIFTPTPKEIELFGAEVL